MTTMAPITAANPSLEQMEARVARFAALEPTSDYVDAGIPGCERTTYRVLGTPPDAPLAAADFHLNLVCCEPGKSAPLPEAFWALYALDGEVLALLAVHAPHIDCGAAHDRRTRFNVPLA